LWPRLERALADAVGRTATSQQHAQHGVIYSGTAQTDATRLRFHDKVQIGVIRTPHRLHFAHRLCGSRTDVPQGLNGLHTHLQIAVGYEGDDRGQE
jgi:hypothetical protein